jgi:uncharacterized protein (DUF433 family)
MTRLEYDGPKPGSAILVHAAPELPARDASLESERTEALVSELHRITVNPEQSGGRPSIRGLRVRVKDVLELLAAGVSREEILADYPYLEDGDITAALEYAAQQSDHPVLRAH